MENKAKERIIDYLSENISTMYSDEEVDVIDEECLVLVDVLTINDENIEIWIPINDEAEYKNNSGQYIMNHPEVLSGVGVKQIKKILVDQEGNPL